jgi:DNA-binding NarL/FixJ family response regulator
MLAGMSSRYRWHVEAFGMFRQDDIRIFTIEHDIYARLAIASYLSWDRRTRLVGHGSEPHHLLDALADDPTLSRLDVVLLDTGVAAGPEGLAALVCLINHHLPEAAVLCLAHTPDVEEVVAAARAGARAYLTREQVGVGLPGAVHFVTFHDFVVTQDIPDILRAGQAPGFSLTLLPERRSYPRLTDRIEQALWLCVIEGLPAERAADEMGVSISTVRSYIKEGYHILEASDDTVFPPSMSPAERAFLRYTALELPESLETQTYWQPAA